MKPNIDDVSSKFDVAGLLDDFMIDAARDGRLTEDRHAADEMFEDNGATPPAP